MVDSKPSADELAKKTRQSMLWFTTLPFIMQVLRFANSIILARLLLPSDFGIIGIISVILYYCDTFSNFGFGKAIIQGDDITREHFTSYFSFNIMVSLLFFTGAQIFSSDIAGFFDTPDIADAIKVFAFLFLITACASGPQVKLNRELNFKTLAIIDAIKVISSMTISLTMALNGYGFWSMIYAMLISQAIALVFLLRATRLYPKFSFNLHCLKDLFHFSLWDFIGGQIKLVGESVDKIIIGKMLGMSPLGFYDKALGLARMPNDQISQRLSNVSFSSFSRIQNDKPALDRYFAKIVTINSVLLLPIFAGLIWVSESFTLVLLGERWLPLVPCLKLLALSFVFTSLANPIIEMNLAASRVKQQAVIRFVLTFGLIVGLVIVAPYGIVSASLAILSFNILLFVASYFLLNSHAHFGWLNLAASLLPSIVMVVFMCLSLYALDLYFNAAREWYRLVLAILVGGMTYTFCFLVIPFKRLDFLRNRVLARLSFGH